MLDCNSANRGSIRFVAWLRGPAILKSRNVKTMLVGFSSMSRWLILETTWKEPGNSKQRDERQLNVLAIAGRLAIALTVVFSFFASATHAAEHVRIGVLKLSSAAPLFLAKDRGYFEQEGIDAELKFFDAAVPIAIAAVSGNIDVGFTGFTGAFYNLAGKGGLKVIAGTAREAPGFQNTAYVASKRAYDAGLRTLADLPGHSVGITQTGSTFHYSLGLIADKLKFDIATVKVVPLQSLPNVAAAIKGGQLDAALTAATTIAPVVASGDAVVLGWVGDETHGCSAASSPPPPLSRSNAVRSRRFSPLIAAVRRNTPAYSCGATPMESLRAVRKATPCLR